MINNYCLATLFVALIGHSTVIQAEQSNKPVPPFCYGHLTELLRNSNFPFRYVSKEKTNLLVNEDTGDSVTAKVVFDMDGTGPLAGSSTRLPRGGCSISQPNWRSPKHCALILSMPSSTSSA